VGKKLSDIRTKIENSELGFYHYLMETEDESVVNSLLELSKHTRVFIFSGVIRNFFLGEKNNRDIDIVLEKEVNIRSIFSNAEIKQNSFGGFKVYLDSTAIDLWYLENTWTFKNEHVPVLPFGLERKVPGTAFFNFSSIVYSFNDKHFYYENEFIEFLKNQEIDVVNKKNPNPKLCIVNSFYYSDKYRLNISENLKDYLVTLYDRNDNDFSEVQLKHFGSVIYSNSQIEHRVETIYLPRKKFKKRKIAIIKTKG